MLSAAAELPNSYCRRPFPLSMSDMINHLPVLSFFNVRVNLPAQAPRAIREAAEDEAGIAMRLVRHCSQK